MNRPPSTHPELRFARVQRETMQQRVFEMLREKLMRGSFAPGQRLKLAELASAFGTSAMPVREAVNQQPLWDAMMDGTIDIIATDHAPHAPEGLRSGKGTQ